MSIVVVITAWLLICVIALGCNHVSGEGYKDDVEKWNGND